MGGYLGRVSPHRVPRQRHSLGDDAQWLSLLRVIQIRGFYKGDAYTTKVFGTQYDFVCDFISEGTDGSRRNLSR